MFFLWAIVLPFQAVISMLGFTSAGITAGSYAASMMASSAVASGGGVAAGGDADICFSSMRTC